MKDRDALRLIEAYIEGWKKGDVEMILSVLTPDCVVREAHGPTYAGREVIERWAREWFAAGNRVLQWEITSFYYAGAVSFVEWHFSCMAGGKRYEFDGASLLKIIEGKIARIHEYQMTAQPFEWSPQ